VLDEQLLTLAQRQHNPETLFLAHFAAASSLYFGGELPASRARMDAGLACYDPSHHRADISRYGFDLKVFLLCILAWSQCLLGYPDQALQTGHEILRLAKELAHPFSEALALCRMAQVHMLRRAASATQASAEALIALSTAHGFPHYVDLGMSLRDWALASQRPDAACVAQLCQSIARRHTLGVEMNHPQWLAFQAEVQARVGQVADGLQALAAGLAMAQKNQELYYEAELHRLRGALLLQQDAAHMSQAEACFQQALEVARRQQAKSLELRAALSLSRLWQQQGKRDKACELLAPVYGWFTEGFDTADLQEARALLEELS